MRKFVVIDFETASKCDLSQAGAWRYAEDPSTEVLCLCISDEAGGVSVWYPDSDRSLVDKLLQSDALIVAHNASFERAIWKHVMKRYGFDNIPLERWHDTMAVCAMARLPLKLKEVTHAIFTDRPELQKTEDAKGRALVVGISKRYTKTGNLERDPATLERVVDYCIQDVRVTAALHARLDELPPRERAVWLLDQEINERGVKLDLDFVEAAQAVLDRALPPLREEFRELVGCNPTQRKKYLTWLQGQGLKVENTQKATLDAILGVEPEEGQDDVDQEEERGGDEGLPCGVLSDDARRALTLGRLLRASSVTKLRTMVSCAGEHDRARGLLQYHGAGTGRWSGRLIQPQNFPRGSIKLKGDPDLVVEATVGAIHVAAKRRDPELVEFLLETPPMEAVASALRHTIVPRSGCHLAVGDFSQIEARIVLALANPKCAALGSFLTGTPYEDMASLIFGRPITKADTEERTIGKNTVLGCGFGMGHKKFFKKYCSNKDEEFALAAIKAYRGYHSRGEWDEEFDGTDVDGWAEDVPALWEVWSDHAKNLLWPDKAPRSAVCPHVTFQLKNGFMAIKLPSGRSLWYPSPKASRKEVWEDLPDDTRRLKKNKFGEQIYSYDWTYEGPRYKVRMYGGLITENIVQALARDLMVEAMHKCEKEGLPIILTVHDEIVCEVPKARQDAAVALKQIMEDTPKWATDLGIPVAAETWQAGRYRK